MRLRFNFFENLQSPYVHGTVGLLMAAAGLVEAISPFVDDVRGNEAAIGAHHGAVLYGLYIVLRSFGESMKGLRELREGVRSVATTFGGRGDAQRPARDE